MNMRAYPATFTPTNSKICITFPDLPMELAVSGTCRAVNAQADSNDQALAQASECLGEALVFLATQAALEAENEEEDWQLRFKERTRLINACIPSPSKTRKGQHLIAVPTWASRMIGQVKQAGVPARKVFTGPRKVFDNGPFSGQLSVSLARWKRFVEDVIAPLFPEVFEELKATAFQPYKQLRHQLSETSSREIDDVLLDCCGSGPPDFRRWPSGAQEVAVGTMAAIDKWASKYNLAHSNEGWQERYDRRGSSFDGDWSTEVALTNLSLWHSIENNPPYVCGVMAQSHGFARGRFHQPKFVIELTPHLEDPLSLDERGIARILRQPAKANIEKLAPEWIKTRDQAAKAEGFVPTKHKDNNELPSIHDLRLFAKYRVGRMTQPSIARLEIKRSTSEFWGVREGVVVQRIRQRFYTLADQLGLPHKLPNPAPRSVRRTAA